MNKAGKKSKLRGWMGWIILILVFSTSFFHGCKKEITDEEVWRRIREIEALEKTKSEKVIDRLIKIFKDEDEQNYPYRYPAAMTLTKLNPEKALNLFIKELKEKGPKFPIKFVSDGQKPFREKVSGLPKASDKGNKNPLIEILGRSRNPFYKRGSWSPKAK